MLYIDSPYGLGYEDWDKKSFDAHDYRSLFKQMEAITSMESYIAVVWSTRDNGAVVAQAMTEQSFKYTQEIVWYKYNQNQEGTQEPGQRSRVLHNRRTLRNVTTLLLVGRSEAP